MNKLYLPTPLLYSHPLSRLTGKAIYLKCESLQQSGAFKDRGIGALCAYYASQSVTGFISSSGGNAGMAVAYASQVLNIPATIVIPVTTPSLIVTKLRAENATVIVHGDSWDESDQLAREMAASNNLAYIPPFDHPRIWEGYVSIIEEIQADSLKPHAIVVSVGGGGLYSGLVQGCESLGWKDVTLLTAETEGAASFAKSFEAKKRIRLDKIDTIATTLGAKQICQHAFDLSQKHPTIPHIVTDKEAVSACLKFADDHRQLVEPACGAALALAYEQPAALQDFDKIVIIVCGGSGVSLSLLQQWKTKFDL
jgi:L-serine/L-threonine ammonia-lyase